MSGSKSLDRERNFLKKGVINIKYLEMLYNGYMRISPGFDYKKAVQAINYFAKREGGQIDKLKLVKLIYLADRFHLRRYGRPILNDVYFAMKLGPAGSAVKDISGFNFFDDTEKEYSEKYLTQGRKNFSIKSVSNVDKNVFSDSDLEALDFAYKEFGRRNASSLVDVTHRYPEWRKFEDLLGTSMTREAMSYLDFFGDPNDGISDKFALPKKTLKASKELFEEECRILGYLG